MSDSERVRVTADYERARQDFAQNGEQQRQDCLQSQAGGPRAGDPTADFGCDTMEPTLSEFLKPQLRFAGEVPGVLTGGAVLLALAALVLGAGFTASEFSTGSIGTWLTFEPRRLRVYGSKLLAAGAGVVPLAVLTLAHADRRRVGVRVPLGQHGGPAGTWSHVAAVGGRGVVLTVRRSPSWARRWASCCGTPPPSSAWRSARPSPARASCAATSRLVAAVAAETNITGWLQHGTTYVVDRCTSADGGYSCETIQKPLSFAHSATYLGVLVVALVLVTALVFRRRDVR